MKTLRFTIILLIALVLGLTGSLRADDNAEKPGMQNGMMMDHCKAMEAKHQEMIARLKDMDAKLDQMVGAMNAAKGSKKTDAMAALVTEMVSQRKTMTMMMHDMESQMMGHMMEHLSWGIAGGIMHSAGNCPMMQGAMKEGGVCPMGKDCPMMKGGACCGSDCPMMKGKDKDKDETEEAPHH